jgi:hypothetical protein
MIHMIHIIRYGATLSVIGSCIILFSLYLNPRLWLQDYPKEIQHRVKPKTREEKRQSLLWGVPFLIALFGIPFLSAWTVRHQDPVAGFLTLFLSAFGVGMFFNLVDLLIIDYLIFCLWTPKFLIIPGTDGMDAYKDYGHHFRGFAVGTVVSTIASLFIVIVVRFL